MVQIQGNIFWRNYLKNKWSHGETLMKCNGTQTDIKQNREKEGLQQGGIREDNAGE